jgi:hypothetical protein
VETGECDPGGAARLAAVSLRTCATASATSASEGTRHQRVADRHAFRTGAAHARVELVERCVERLAGRGAALLERDELESVRLVRSCQSCDLVEPVLLADGCEAEGLVDEVGEPSPGLDDRRAVLGRGRSQVREHGAIERADRAPQLAGVPRARLELLLHARDVGGRETRAALRKDVRRDERADDEHETEDQPDADRQPPTPRADLR